jgi:hypothetical protein
MQLSALLRLCRADLWHSRGRMALCCLAIALAVAVGSATVAFGLGVRDAVLQQVVQELPIDTLEVRSKTLELGVLAFEAGGLFGAPALNDDTLQALRALPEVQAAYPRLDVHLPVGAQGGQGLLGKQMYTDLFMAAILPEQVADEHIEGFTDRQDVIPVLISPQLIDIYNTSVAPALGTPRLGKDALVGFRFELRFGHSLLLGSRGARAVGTQTAQIVGTSRHAMRLGVTVPMPVARRLLQQYGSEPPGPYSSVVLKLVAPRRMGEAVEHVQGLGLSVDATAQKTRRLFAFAIGISAGMGALLLLFAGLTLAQSFAALLASRRRELGIFASVGASRRDLTLLLLLQALALGLLGSVGGLAAARLTCSLLDALLHTCAPQLPFLPPSLFNFPPSLALAALLSGCTAAVVGALVPALRAARLPICEALRL